MNEEQKEILKEIKILVNKLEESIKETKDWRGGTPNELPPKK